MTERKIRSLLYKLGRGPNKIAEKLKKINCIADRYYDGLSCPLAKYLNSNGLVFVNVCSNENNEIQCNNISFKPSKVINRFIDNMDNGNYRFLRAELND